MDTIKNAKSSSGKKEYKRWKKSVTKDELTKSISVEECENGFIVEICEEGKKGNDWKYETKRWISKENPLNELDLVKEDKESDWKQALDALGI